MSNRHPSRSTVRLMPPTTSSDSSTTQLKPRRVSSCAAVRPAGPAPTTTQRVWSPAAATGAPFPPLRLPGTGGVRWPSSPTVQEAPGSYGHLRWYVSLTYEVSPTFPWYSPLLLHISWSFTLLSETLQYLGLLAHCPPNAPLTLSLPHHPIRLLGGTRSGPRPEAGLRCCPCQRLRPCQRTRPATRRDRPAPRRDRSAPTCPWPPAWPPGACATPPRSAPRRSRYSCPTRGPGRSRPGTPTRMRHCGSTWRPPASRCTCMPRT